MIYNINKLKIFFQFIYKMLKISKRLFSDMRKIKTPPIVYIQGEEMTKYTMDLIMNKWINKYLDTSNWKFYDLSCKNRDITDDKCLYDAVEDGKVLRSIFKEPTITPSEYQKYKLNLTKSLPSPNGYMRKEWNGITISRDTIHIKNLDLGYKNQVLFDRHAVGGEYTAGFKEVNSGTLITTFHPDKDFSTILVDKRNLKDKNNVVVTYHTPLDNVNIMAHEFFNRCLKYNVTPYVVTKKTVFKWQESFWKIIKDVFDEKYKTKFNKLNLLERTNNDLMHLISDAATMNIIKWKEGGFGMISHNYDGDMLSDEISQMHFSPGFITSNFIGMNSNNDIIKQFEASHGTVSDMWEDHLKGKETSLNPLGMIHALISAINYSVKIDTTNDFNKEEILLFTKNLQAIVNKEFVDGNCTRDLNKNGLTTEEFIKNIENKLFDFHSKHLR